MTPFTPLMVRLYAPSDGAHGLRAPMPRPRTTRIRRANSPCARSWQVAGVVLTGGARRARAARAGPRVLRSTACHDRTPAMLTGRCAFARKALAGDDRPAVRPVARRPDADERAARGGDSAGEESERVRPQRAAAPNPAAVDVHLEAVGLRAATWAHLPPD